MASSVPACTERPRRRSIHARTMVRAWGLSFTSLVLSHAPPPTRRPRDAPSARTKRACATPFHVAQSPALRADHEKLGHRRPKRGGARSSGLGAEKSVADSRRVWNGQDEIAGNYTNTHTVCVGQGRQPVAHGRVGDARRRAKSPLHLFPPPQPLRSPFAESFSAFARLPTRPTTRVMSSRAFTSSDVRRWIARCPGRARARARGFRSP